MNPSDTTYALIREATEGVTPATPALSLLDWDQSGGLGVDAKMLSGKAQRANRESTGARKDQFSLTGTLSCDLRRDPASDFLIESGCSGTFASNVLKAGRADTSHTIVKRQVEGAQTLYSIHRGVQVNKLTISAKTGENATISYDMIGMTRELVSANPTGYTYVQPTQGALIAGIDANAINIGGLTALVTELELTVEHTREAKFALGSAYSRGTGTAGNRTVKLTAKLFKTSFDAETLFTSDTPVAVSFNLGTGANGYGFSLPAVVGSIPKDEVNGSNQLITVEMWAQNSAADNTGLIITKLA